MLQDSKAFSSFSVDDLDKAKKFYGETLGLKVAMRPEMGLEITFGTSAHAFAYPKDNHEPATFTILNFPVEDIDKAVDELTAKGVKFEQYTGFLQTDKKGIARSDDPNRGPNMAWFKDPAGNILALMQ